MPGKISKFRENKSMANSSFVKVKFDQVLANGAAGKKRKPRVGDHLITARLGYTHHGVYVGKGEVIHYSGFHSGLNSGPVVKTSIGEFANQSHVMVNFLSKRKYAPSESVSRAFSKLGEAKYNLVSNNCEHFVNWCIHGRATSKQVSEMCLLLCSPAFISRFSSINASPTLLRSTSSLIANHVSSMVVPHLSRSVAQGVASNLAGMTSGVIGGGLTSTASIGVVGVVGGVSAPIMVSIAAGVAIGYGVKKAWDWIAD